MKRYMSMFLIVLILLGLCSAASATEAGVLRDIYEPETELVLAPTVIQTVDSAEKMEALNSNTPPQGAWFQVEEENVVKFRSGSTTLEEALQACGNKVMPVLEVSNETVAGSVCSYLLDHNITDVMIASSSTDALAIFSIMRPQYTYLAYIASGEPADIARAAHRISANICVLQNPDQQTVEYLQARFLTVTLKAESGTTRDCVKAAINVGANGVVVTSADETYEMYREVTTTSYVRRPFTVGHRGIPSIAPENTVEGMKAAYDAGADAVECDVHITKDKQLVVNHNGNLKGYTTDADATAAVTTLTREQLKQYTLSPKGDYTNCKFAFLDEQFEVLKQYPDKLLVVEIKTADTRAPGMVYDLAKEYNVLDQIVIISFSGTQVNESRLWAPELGASLLASGSTTLEDAVLSVVAIGASFSPDSSVSAELVTQLMRRGISVNTWTINTEEEMNQNIVKGVQFITTDYADRSATLSLSLPSVSVDTVWADETPVWLFVIGGVGAVVVLGAVAVGVWLFLRSRKKL